MKKIVFMVKGIGLCTAFIIFWSIWLDMVASSTLTSIDDPVNMLGAEKGGVLFIPPLFLICIIIMCRGIYGLFPAIPNHAYSKTIVFNISIRKVVRMLISLLLSWLVFLIVFEGLACFQMARYSNNTQINSGMYMQMRQLCGFDKGLLSFKSFSYIVDMGEANAFLAVNDLKTFHVWRIPVVDPMNIVCIR